MKSLVVAAVCGALVALGIIAFVNGWPAGGDTAVYRAGAVALLEGHPLYAADVLPAEPDWARLPFTYPPTAALLFVPLAAVPPQVAWGILLALSVLGLVAVVWLVLRALPSRQGMPSSGWVAVLLGLGLLVIDPVRITLEYGQINVILMALVVLDVLALRGRRWSGVLVGVAAAVKLTPLIFVVHLALTGRRADAARALGTFVGLQVLLWVIARNDLVRYWTHTVHDPTRIGPTHWLWNQSLAGMVRRLSEMAPWSQPLAYLLGVAVAVPAAWFVLRFHRRDRPVHALLVSAFAALLISPVSWLHHWVWAVPLIVLLLAEAWQGSGQARWLLATTVVVYALPSIRTMPSGEGREFRWNVIQVVVGNAYVLVPVLVGVVLLVSYRREARRRPEQAQVG